MRASIPNLSPDKSSFVGSRTQAPNQRNRKFTPLVAESDNGVTTDGEPQNPEATPAEKPKRSPLTARERLRAARVLGRYNAESAPRKPDLGSKVLAALKESDKGKKTGLPEAPGNMLDDSKRGMPPKGLTFDFPGGADLFFIGVSFVTITTIMFGTTFLVWKLGAIHFND